MRVRHASATLALLLAAAVAAGQQATVPLSDDELAFVEAHPTVRLMVDRHAAPVGFRREDAVHHGMVDDVLTVLSNRTGLTFEPVPQPPDQPPNVILAPNVDGIALSALTAEREKYYLGTDPLFEVPASILTRATEPGYLTPSDLDGRRVGVVAGFACGEHLRTNYPELTLLEYPTAAAGLRALSAGEVNAVVVAIPLSGEWLDAAGFGDLRVAGETGYVHRLAMITRKDWPELHSILQKGVQSIAPRERDDIRRRWLNPPPDPFYLRRAFWVPVLWAAAGVLAVWAVMLAWSYRLRRAVWLRTHELKAAEALYRGILDGVSDAVLLARADGSLVYASAGVRRVFGRDPDEVARGDLVALFGEAFAAKAATGTLRNEEFQSTDLDGRTRSLLVSASPVAIRDAVRLIVCHDVTDRHRLERQVRQKKTLETVGLLASGVAHDFNNLLQVIGGFAQMAGSEVATAAARKNYLSRVTEATDRATSLTRQLLAVARRKPSEKSPVAVARLTAELIPLLVPLVSRRVRIDHPTPPPDLIVFSDPTQIEQVLLNLLVNARDAMPDGGTATIAWDAVVRTAEEVAPHPNVAPGRFVRLRVTDTGDGIPAAIRSKIFEPFFTTKGEGKGTGLGLSVVLGVAHDAGGFVEVESEEGRGTTFEVYWPQAGGPAPPPVTREG